MRRSDERQESMCNGAGSAEELCLNGSDSGLT